MDKYYPRAKRHKGHLFSRKRQGAALSSPYLTSEASWKLMMTPVSHWEIQMSHEGNMKNRGISIVQVLKKCIPMSWVYLLQRPRLTRKSLHFNSIKWSATACYSHPTNETSRRRFAETGEVTPLVRKLHSTMGGFMAKAIMGEAGDGWGQLQRTLTKAVPFQKSLKTESIFWKMMHPTTTNLDALASPNARRLALPCFDRWESRSPLVW